MTNERARHFRSSVEVRQARSRFDESCLVSLEEFSSLVGAYGFRENDAVCCQLTLEGSRCNQPHMNGWIAKTKSGAEGFIGRQCARKHFNADVNFAREVRRVDLELEIDRLIERLTGLLADPALPETIADARERQSALRSQIRIIREELPHEVWKRLEDMRKTGNRVIQIEVRYVEKDENGKERHTWVADNLGAVSGLGVLDYDRLRGVIDLVEAAELTRDHARPTREEARQDLKRWVDALEALSAVTVELGDLEGELELFRRPENLRLLAYAVRNQEARVRSAAFAIANSDQSDPRLAVPATLKAWDDEVRKAKAGRDFRII